MLIVQTTMHAPRTVVVCRQRPCDHLVLAFRCLHSVTWRSLLSLAYSMQVVPSGCSFMSRFRRRVLLLSTCLPFAPHTCALPFLFIHVSNIALHSYQTSAIPHPARCNACTLQLPGAGYSELASGALKPWFGVNDITFVQGY